jgi:hypothetical protein
MHRWGIHSSTIQPEIAEATEAFSAISKASGLSRLTVSHLINAYIRIKVEMRLQPD